jgi:LysR family transcriptional activator of nhaA
MYIQDRVLEHADEIFALGRELQDALHDRPRGQALRFAVGVADTLPKVLVHRLLAPAFEAGDDVRVTFIDGEPERLLAQLALHELDLVVSDYPASPRLGLKAFTHVLGECGVTFLATAGLARGIRKGFPGSLTGAPMLLPVGTSALRRSLDQWFDERDIHPRIVGEFSDSALLKAFGAAGDGVFAAPTAVEDEVLRMYGVRIVGREPGIRERFYAISVEKRLKHPAVVAISRAARTRLFRE